MDYGTVILSIEVKGLKKLSETFEKSLEEARQKR